MPDVDGAFGRLFASRAFALALRAFAPFVALMLRLLALAVRTQSQLTRCVAVNVMTLLQRREGCYGRCPVTSTLTRLIRVSRRFPMRHESISAAKGLVSYGRERLACEKRRPLFHPLGEK
jgi:hypothetical protein